MASISTILGDIYVDDRGSSESVALLWPSLFTDHTMWRFQVEALCEAGWRTLALDPPGHGRSKGPKRNFTMDECAQAALQVLDASNVRTPIVFLGTSWGGMIAPRVALSAPARVRGMVLFNTTAESASPLERVKNSLLTVMLAIPALDTMVDRISLSLQLCEETRRRKPELGAELSKSFRSWNRAGVINSVRAVLVNRDSTLERLGSVSVPALVVSGAHDTLLPSVHSDLIANKLQNARRIDVSGAAHLTPLEQPDATNKLVLDFVQTLEADAGEKAAHR